MNRLVLGKLLANANREPPSPLGAGGRERHREVLGSLISSSLLLGSVTCEVTEEEKESKNTLNTAQWQQEAGQVRLCLPNGHEKGWHACGKANRPPPDHR